MAWFRKPKQPLKSSDKRDLPSDVFEKCTGCGACMVACMSENNVPFREDESDKPLSITWMRVYKLTNGKSFPDTEVVYMPRPCQHCSGLGDHGQPLRVQP